MPESNTEKNNKESQAFESLANTKVEPLARPAVSPRAQTLPFTELPWRTFEQLCCQLIASLPGVVGTPHLYGKPGDEQNGIDIIARFNGRNDGKVCCFQCKNHNYFSPASFKDAIQNVAFESDKIVFIISSRAGTGLRDIEQENPKVELWDHEDLSAKLKSHSALVTRRLTG